MRKLEYSLVAQRKLKTLHLQLTEEYGTNISKKIIKQITSAARGLETFAEKGVSISSLYGIDSDYRYIFVSHNYLFYRIEDNKIIIIEIFDERENFIYKLFGISNLSHSSIDSWNE